MSSENQRSIAITEASISDFIPTVRTEEGKFKYSYTIPIFQREFVWEYSDLKNLWDSIYRNYPIGSFMIWESEEELLGNRQIAENIYLVKAEGTKYKYILDGQQRLTSLIVSILKGKKKKEGRKNPTDLTLYFSLRNAKKEMEIEEFEEKKKIPLFFTQNDVKKMSDEEKRYLIDVAKLVNFDTEVFSKFFKSGEEEYANLYHVIYQKLHDYKLSIITLKNIPKEEVAELFTRVNTSGKKLSTIDLITAYTYNDDFYLRGDNYLEKLFGEDGDLDTLNYNDLDPLLFIRLISMIKFDSCTESDLFKLKSKDFKEQWNRASDALIEAVQFLRELNITSSIILPYSPMAVSMSYFFYLLKEKTMSDDIKKAIVRWFWIKSLNGSYQGATNEEIAKDCVDFRKYLETNTGFSFSLTKNIDNDALINEKLNLSSGFCKTLLCLMANNKPYDFTNHKEINIYDVLVEYKKSELHHIFPRKSDIGKKFSEDEINSIMNICFLPKFSNGSVVRNTNPSDYFNNKVKPNPNWIEDLKSNFIPYDNSSGIWNDEYKQFLKQRSELILNNIKSVII